MLPSRQAVHNLGVYEFDAGTLYCSPAPAVLNLVLCGCITWSVLERSKTRSRVRKCVAQVSTLSPVRSRVHPLAVSRSHTSELGVATKTQCLF